jgi:hypothetical protein
MVTEPDHALIAIALSVIVAWAFSGHLVGTFLKQNASLSTDSTGWAIGKSENLLVVLFCLADEITGLAVLVAAKAIVRKSASDEDTSYRVAGTLINLSWSLLVGLTARVIVFGVPAG